ncbi:unnamed protein product [Calicophoron daubneyi]|uniref:Uncharacterized protein n=1 Tax=Calicophoron daubneyi TaxID=300641 RepID=A0AAV2THD1_CALDB
MEIVGRVYLQYTEQHISETIPRLPEIRLPENVLFYLWILQNECDKAAENGARVDRNLDKNKIDDCLVVRIATHLSPSFRDLLKCPLDSDCDWSIDDDTSGDRNPRFSQRVFYPPKPNR